MAKKNKKRINSPKKGATKNPLYEKQQAFLKTLSERERNELFHPKVSAERRAELWMEQADLGEELVNQYAWATPSPHALKILREFSPIVEVGCGANAYWAYCMKEEGIDVTAYDIQVDTGGKIKSKKGKGKSIAPDSLVQQGGPSSLEKHKDRTLFLCYPDEDGEGMGEQCLAHYTGTYVIHVGESILDANLSMDQAPWGRSSSSNFQIRLAAEYHCILKVQLPSWLHVRDSISVWKRSETSTIVFAADSDEEGEEDEEIEYRHVPISERLPINVAASCCEHLLPSPAAASAPSPVKQKDGKKRVRSLSSEDQPMQEVKTERKEKKGPARSRSDSNDSKTSKKSKKRGRSDSTDSRQSRPRSRPRSDSVDSQKKRKRSNSTDSTTRLGARPRSDSTDSAKKRRKLEKEHQKAIDSLFAGGYEVDVTPPRKKAKGGSTTPW